MPEGLTWVTEGATAVLEVLETVLTTITGNAFFAMVLVGGTIIPLGIRIFRKFKH